MKKTLLSLVALFIAINVSAGIGLNMKKNQAARHLLDAKKERLMPLKQLQMAKSAQTMAKAPAAEVPAEAEGTLERYAGFGYVYNQDFDEFVLDYGMRSDFTFSADGETVYIHDIIPGCQKKGTYTIGKLGVNAGGNRTITVKADQLITSFETFDELCVAMIGMTAQEYCDWILDNYGEEMTVEELMEFEGWAGPMHFYFVPVLIDYDNDEEVFLDEYVLIEEAGGYFVPAVGEDVDIALIAYSYDDDAMYNAVMDVFLSHVTQTPCVVPDDVEYQSYAHMSESVYTNNTDMCKIAQKGANIYIPGLIVTMPDAYAEGTITTSGTIEITPNQLMMSDKSHYYMLLRGATGVEIDYDYFEVVYDEIYDNLTLNYNFNNGKITTDEGIMVGELYAGEWGYDVLGGGATHRFLKYEGPKPATPLAPEDVCYWDDWGVVDFYLRYEDVNGNYIDPANLSYECFVDGDETEPYVFLPSVYYGIEEDMTVVPALFVDYFDDFYCDSEVVSIYWYEDVENIGFRSICEVDGVVNKSPVTWYLPVEVGIKNNTASQKTGISYNLAGQKVKDGYRGIIIRDGQKKLMK